MGRYHGRCKSVWMSSRWPVLLQADKRTEQVSYLLWQRGSRIRGGRKKSLRYEAVSRRDQKRMRGAGELSKIKQLIAPRTALCYRLSVGPHLPQIVITAGPCASVSDSGTPEVWRLFVIPPVPRYTAPARSRSCSLARDDINPLQEVSAVVHMCSYEASRR